MEKGYTVLRYFTYSIVILLLYILQGTPGLIPEIFGARPVLLIPAAFCMAAFEKQIPALFFSLACGVLCDLSSTGVIGFFSFGLTLTCFLEAELFERYIVRNFLNTVLVSFLGCTALLCLYFLIFVLPQDFAGGFYYFLRHYVSKILYTFVFTAPLYALNAFFCKIMRKKL